MPYELTVSRLTDLGGKLAESHANISSLNVLIEKSASCMTDSNRSKNFVVSSLLRIFSDFRADELHY
jgi:hypothetical protein